MKIRRIWFAPSLFIAALPASVVTSPASGAAPGSPSVETHVTSFDPVTTGWTESGTAGHATTYLQTNDVSASWFNGDPSQGVISQIFNGDQGGESITLDVPGGVPTVGTTYTGGSGVHIDVWDPTSIVCDTAKGDVASARVDQLSGTQATLTTLAITYTCQTGSGRIYRGAFGHNIAPSPMHAGYYVYESNGLITGYGNDRFLSYLGDLSAQRLNQPIVGMAQTADGGGYWMAASDGGIFTYGDASFLGSAGGVRLNKPIVGMAATPSGNGYWLVASDGGIFTYGDAQFYGSTGSIHLNKPIVGMAATPTGHGYWLVASDGGIFTYGDAVFYGSTGNIHLNRPVVGMTAAASGEGYWLVASDGGIFSYGDSAFYGSTGSIVLNRPIVGMTATRSGGGYWFTAADGGVFNYGDAGFVGSLPGDGMPVDDVVGLST